MKRFYYSRVKDRKHGIGSVMIAGVIEADTLPAAQAALDTAFWKNRSPTTHESFDWVDLDEAPKRTDGILVTTLMHR